MSEKDENQEENELKDSGEQLEEQKQKPQNDFIENMEAARFAVQKHIVDLLFNGRDSALEWLDISATRARIETFDRPLTDDEKTEKKTVVMGMLDELDELNKEFKQVKDFWQGKIKFKELQIKAEREQLAEGITEEEDRVYTLLSADNRYAVKVAHTSLEVVDVQEATEDDRQIVLRLS